MRGLYAITPDAIDSASLLDKVARALDGGLSMLQYRRKRGHADEARALVELAQPYDVPVIINDDPRLALEVHAAGAHLGRDDGDLAHARANLEGMLLGASCYNSLDAARKAVAAGADYVAFGSVFSSPTKPAAVRAPLSLFECDLGVPLCAIGGVTLANAPQLVEAGADLLAVITDLFDAPDITARVRQYGRLFE